MAEMALGYGSEYQLLRFLGHHRQKFEKVIRESTRLTGKLEWLDQPPDHNRKSLDGEYEGIVFLPPSEQQRLNPLWNGYWADRGNNIKVPSWDAVLKHDDEWVLIEAKANLDEFKSDPCGSTDDHNRKRIADAMEQTKTWLGIETHDDWMNDYYQLANRLAFVYFLRHNGIKCSLLYVYFLNGYEKEGENKSIKSKNDWEIAIKKQYTTLGINDEAKKYISEIFIDAKIKE